LRREVCVGRGADSTNGRRRPTRGCGFFRLRLGRLLARAHGGAGWLPGRVVPTIPGCKVDVGAADSHDRRVLAMNADRGPWHSGGASDSRN
jgi:hypothetical protein